MKQLIPVGSIRSDPIGTERYMEIDLDAISTTAAKTVIFYKGIRQEPTTSSFRFDWAGGLSNLRGTINSVELAHEASDLRGGYQNGFL